METYFSTDVETDGPIPGKFSMLSFGSAAFLANGTLLDTYSANLERIPGALQDKDTMDWWNTQPQAWEAHRKNTKPPEIVMPEYISWVQTLSQRERAKPVFVGYPATFDFMFMYYYMIAFAGTSPFSFSALDIKTLAMAALGIDFRQTTKKVFPKFWFGPSRHNHVALDDAIEQGELFCNILRQVRG